MDEAARRAATPPGGHTNDSTLMPDGLHPQTIEPMLLTGIVRRALGNEALALESWEIHRIHGGIGPATSGVYRVAGTAYDDAGTRTWSLVLKVLRVPTAGTTYLGLPTEGWNREILTYRSGLLDTLPPGLAAPRCYAITEQPGAVWLWLEEVTDEVGPRWPMAQFARAARHLGRLSGTYLAARPLPDYPWLQRDLLRWRAEANVGFWADFGHLREAPWVRVQWPEDLADRALRLWHERQRWLDLLDRLPQALIHGDADRRNLFARQGPAGDETVAIDWAFTGVAALGEEMVNLAVTSALWFQVEVADLPDLAGACLDGYVAGLRDVGWQGDPRLAQVGFSVAAALRIGPFVAAQRAKAGPELLAQVTNRPVEEALACWEAVRRFTFDQFDQVRGLIETL